MMSRRRVIGANEGKLLSADYAKDTAKLRRHNASPLMLISLLKHEWASNESSGVDRKTDESHPRSPKELDMPECTDDSECTFDSVCVRGPDGYRTCICAGACPPCKIFLWQKCERQDCIRLLAVPVSCRSEGKYADDYCLSMSDEYREKYLMPKPMCKTGVCVCPPMFENWLGFEGFVSLLPIKCSKRELRVQGFAYPSDTVYVGGNVKLFCCINIDPRSFVPEDGIRFIHNSSIVRRSSFTPFSNGFMDGVEPSRCWQLDILNVQLLDGGPYTCCAHVSPTETTRSIEANDTFVLTVKARFVRGKSVALLNDHDYHLQRNRLPRDAGLTDSMPQKTNQKLLSPTSVSDNSTLSSFFISSDNKKLRLISNLKVEPNSTCAKVSWDEDSEVVANVELRLIQQSNMGIAEIWRINNATSGTIVCDLQPDTVYTLEISAIGWSNDMMNNTTQFTTLESEPGLPILHSISLSQLNMMSYCSLHWAPPANKNGRIIKYYVSVYGSVRSSPSGILISNDYPLSVDSKCFNDRGEFSKGINAEKFSDNFLCKFGPLKPNRNYTATVWAENKAGRSPPATFSGNCITPYGRPDNVVAPTVKSGNTTSFELRFETNQDEANGPIVCFYLAIVPLLESVSVDSLPKPDSLRCDVFSEAMNNNVEGSARKLYKAYIAESYAKYPNSTVVGDGDSSGNIEPCSVPYMSVYRAQDMPLRPHIKYTGFLIARVESNNGEQQPVVGQLSKMDVKKRFKKRIKRHSAFLYQQGDKRRIAFQSFPSHRGPEYAYSAYFKPIVLKSDSSKTGLSLGTVCIMLFALFFMAVVVAGAVILYRRGFLIGAFAKKEDSPYVYLRQTFGSIPIPVAELLDAYKLRSRDSNRGFDKEFEALPRTERFHKTCVSKLPENREKNRYSDKHTFDDTRVKLKHPEGSLESDYINANYVNGYKNKKKFIATQGPKDSTQNDFWQMVWQQDARVIVMITKLQEGSLRQCSQYWPDRHSTKAYGEYEVRHTAENICSDYVIREFEMRLAKKQHSANGFLNGQSAVVTYVADHENGVTVEPSAVTVTRPVSEHGSEKSAKISINYENLFTNTKNLQEPRKIVQYHFTSWPDFGTPKCTTSFLRFVHRLRSLDDFNTHIVIVHCSAGCGRTGTFIAIDSLLDQCVEKDKVNIFGFVSHLRNARGGMIQTADQYQFVYRALTTWHLYGNTDIDENSFRDYYNRLLQPSDEVRQGTGLSSSVVAALFKSAPDTRENVGQHDCKPTTMIEEEFKYWPNEVGKSVSFGTGDEVSVKLVEESLANEAKPTYILRKITYKFAQEKFYHEVTQFDYLCWPKGRPVPTSMKSLISLIDLVLESQVSRDKDTFMSPIILHSRDGSSETGIFCCITLLLERLRSEKSVDVFQTVRSLQRCRPRIVTSLVVFTEYLQVASIMI
uniref:protein-tyrosine-phosphatase n=1 Tax=Syphacia muris TaxID=451379 RepID=A0A0N5AZD9_9BILA